MSCTAEEIAEKRRIAQARLKAKQTATCASLNTKSLLTHTTTTSAPLKAQLTHAATINIIVPEKNSVSFYGASNKTNCSTGSTYQPLAVNQQQQQTINKLKASPSFKDNRTKYGPYANRNNSLGNTQKNDNQTVAAIFRKTISCTCSMITEKRFVVTPSAYHAQLIEVLKSIPSKAYGWYQITHNFIILLNLKF